VKKRKVTKLLEGLRLPVQKEKLQKKVQRDWGGKKRRKKRQAERFKTRRKDDAHHGKGTLATVEQGEKTEGDEKDNKAGRKWK